MRPPAAICAQEILQHVRDQDGGLDRLMETAVLGSVFVEFLGERLGQEHGLANVADLRQGSELQVGHLAAP
jgi:hypothetical protein